MTKNPSLGAGRFSKSIAGCCSLTVGLLWRPDIGRRLITAYVNGQPAEKSYPPAWAAPLRPEPEAVAPVAGQKDLVRVALRPDAPRSQPSADTGPEEVDRDPVGHPSAGGWNFSPLHHLGDVIVSQQLPQLRKEGQRGVTPGFPRTSTRSILSTPSPSIESSPDECEAAIHRGVAFAA